MIHFFTCSTSVQFKKTVLFCAAFLFSSFLFAQQNMGETKRPKLVVGIVVDQMRWDFLYRYANRYGNDGFKRLLREGFSCENTMIPYTPTITACGHTCVYTGSVPAVHGIVGNNWFSRELSRVVYCSEDTAAKTVGSTSTEGEMSPRNMLATTMGDELRLATNFKSKVVGIAIKDRGAILPAGHSANAAYWYDGTAGKFISSTYYMDSLPNWVNSFNAQQLPSQYIQKGWQTLYPVNTYTQSTPDEESYEGRFSNENTSSFPHTLKGSAKAPFEILASTPFGNSYTLDFAKSVIQNYHLGSNGVTDMLCVSISSTDYVGHQFGPNSVETEDTYLRLDKDLASFFQYLDKTIGKNEYTVFLTADHGVIHVPGFLQEHKLPGGSFDEKSVKTKLDSLLQLQGISKGIIDVENYQVYLNYAAIAAANKNVDDVKQLIIQQLLQMPQIANAVDLQNLTNTTVQEPLKTMMTNGFNRKRSGDVQYILQPGWLAGYTKTGTGHGVYYPYDAHIPLVWMGWGIHAGKTNAVTYMTDIAPTVAALLQIQMPSGCTGKPIVEVTGNK